MIRLELSMARFAADVGRCYRVLFFQVHSIRFHSLENFLAFVAGLREDPLLFDGMLRRMFRPHVEFESFFPVENFLAFFALSPSNSSDHRPLGIVVRLVVFLQIVVAFGSVWTEGTEEARLRHVCVDVRPQQRLLTENFLALITDEWILVGGRPTLSLLRFFDADELSVHPPSMMFDVVLLSELFSAEENRAAATHEELVVEFRRVFGD